MSTIAKRVESVKQELRNLNQKFAAGELVNESFYRQLSNFGLSTNNCVLFEFFPDGSQTYCGKAVRQDGSYFFFDIDLSHPEFSTVGEITKQVDSLLKNVASNTPWQKEIVALTLLDKNWV